MATSQLSFDGLRGPVPLFLTHELRLVGVGFRPELLHAPVENFGKIQVAFLIDRDRVGSIELSGLAARPAPAVQIVAVQIVFDDPVCTAVGDPQELVRRNDMSIRR